MCTTQTEVKLKLQLPQKTSEATDETDRFNHLGHAVKCQ